MDYRKEYEKLEKKLNKIIDSGISLTNENIEKEIRELKVKLHDLYEKIEVQGKPSEYEFNKYNRRKKLDKDIYESITRMYKENNSILRATLNQVALISLKETKNIISIELDPKNKKLHNIDKNIKVSEIVNERMAGLHWTERMGIHRNRAIDETAKVIKEGIAKGKSYNEMAKDLADRLGVDKNKTKSIINTETRRCISKGRIDLIEEADKNGIILYKEWISSKDEAVRTAHSELDGTIIKADEDFTSSLGGKGKTPRHMNNASDDINCRCDVIIYPKSEKKAS